MRHDPLNSSGPAVGSDGSGLPAVEASKAGQSSLQPSGALPTHAPKLAIQGVSEEGAERLLDYKDHPELDDLDKLVVEYSIAVTNNWNTTRDAIFGRLKEHFTEAQIVELTWRIALCGAFNRFNDILQLDVEQGVVRQAAE